MNEKTKAKRTLLKAISAGIRPLVKEGVYNTVNKGLEEIYKEESSADHFKHITQWNKDGYRVIKGEKGFLFWGRPKEYAIDKSPVKDGETEEEKKIRYFPVCHLFSNLQVSKKAA